MTEFELFLFFFPFSFVFLFSFFSLFLLFSLFRFFSFSLLLARTAWLRQRFAGAGTSVPPGGGGAGRVRLPAPAPAAPGGDRAERSESRTRPPAWSSASGRLPAWCAWFGCLVLVLVCWVFFLPSATKRLLPFGIYLEGKKKKRKKQRLL